MACNHDRLCPSNSVGTSIAAFSSPLFPSTLNLCSRNLASTPIRVTSPSVSTTSFTWDDVVRISDSQHSSTHPADLQGFFEKIRLCNRGLEKQSDFLPFVIEDQTVGYIKELYGQKCIWIGKRSQVKATYPGMLDLLVGGGLPHGLASKENLMKECEEEAGIPRSISKVAVSVGAVSYGDIDEYEYK